MSQHCGHETLNSLTDFDQLIVSIITEVAVGNEGDDGEYGWHVQYANAARPYICQPKTYPNDGETHICRCSAGLV